MNEILKILISEWYFKLEEDESYGCELLFLLPTELDSERKKLVLHSKLQSDSDFLFGIPLKPEHEYIMCINEEDNWGIEYSTFITAKTKKELIEKVEQEKEKAIKTLKLVVKRNSLDYFPIDKKEYLYLTSSGNIIAPQELNIEFITQK